MIEVSSNATSQIRKLVARQGLPPTAGLRVAVKAGGCSGLSYVFAWEEAPRATDHVIEPGEGARVFVDPKSLRLLDGSVLDYDTSLLSKGFFLHNPKAKSTCGCGASFSL